MTNSANDTPELSIASNAIDVDSVAAVLTIKLSAASTGTVIVGNETREGQAAKEVVEYAATSGTLEFTPG